MIVSGAMQSGLLFEVFKRGVSKQMADRQN